MFFFRHKTKRIVASVFYFIFRIKNVLLHNYLFSMKHTSLFIFCGLLTLFMFSSSACSHQKKNGNRDILSREFYHNSWERFDYISNDIAVKEGQAFDLSLNISFTEEYPYDNFSMVFTIFDEDDTPYRSKSYSFKLKDADGQWHSELKDGCYTFDLPINQDLTFSESGTYKFQIESRMPITPLVGIRQLRLINNN